MKITINVECTPEEARKYMGLPDVAPMQEAVLREMQERMLGNMTSIAPAEMIKTWLPMGVENWLEIQKAFWNQMTSATTRTSDKP